MDPSGHTKYKVTGFPPANQTKYKRWRKMTINVTKIKKFGERIKAYGNRAMAAGAVVALKFQLIGAVTAAAGGAVYLSGDYVASSMDKFKKLCKFQLTTYFKWKNSKKTDYRYDMKNVGYVVYRNKKKISKKRTTIFHGKAKLY